MYAERKQQDSWQTPTPFGEWVCPKGRTETISFKARKGPGGKLFDFPRFLHDCSVTLEGGIETTGHGVNGA